MKDIGNVFILGDSYSTFEGCIPEGYAVYYSSASYDEFKISKKEDTWWVKLLNETKSNLIMNDSCSGSTISFTGYDGADYKHISFVTRMKKYLSYGFFKKNPIDTFFIFGATNDSWINFDRGKKNTGFSDDLSMHHFYPAIEELFRVLKSEHISKRMIYIINTGLYDDVKDYIIELCKKNNIEYLELKEFEKENGHPTEKGMTEIKEQVLEYL